MREASSKNRQWHSLQKKVPFSVRDGQREGMVGETRKHTKEAHLCQSSGPSRQAGVPGEPQKSTLGGSLGWMQKLGPALANGSFTAPCDQPGLRNGSKHLERFRTAPVCT